VVFLRPELIGPAKEDVDAQLRAFERLAFSGALINLLIISLLNPLPEDRVSERVPTILQDAIVTECFCSSRPLSLTRNS
jgi:hypothetical protein